MCCCEFTPPPKNKKKKKRKYENNIRQYRSRVSMPPAITPQTSIASYGNAFVRALLSSNTSSFSTTLRDLLTVGLPVLVFVPSFPRTYDSRLTFRAAWDLPRSSSRACSRRPILRPFFLPFFDTVLLAQRGVEVTGRSIRKQTAHRLIGYSPCVLLLTLGLCPGKLLTIPGSGGAFIAGDPGINLSLIHI